MHSLEISQRPKCSLQCKNTEYSSVNNCVHTAISSSISATSSQSYLTYIGIGSIYLGVIGICGNLPNCIVIVTYKPLRSRLPNYFLLNQSFIDLILVIIYTSNIDNLQLTGIG